MEENHRSPKNQQKRFGPILWPLILIAIGILLLLDTLGFLGQSTWKILWNLWPILFIALGLDALFNKKQIFSPVFWFGLGSILILGNFNLLGWDIWNTLFHLWPLLLVTAGLEILLGKRSIWISLLVILLVLGILAVALGFTGTYKPTHTTTKSTILEPIGEAEAAEILFALGFGELHLVSLDNSDDLLKGEISTNGANIRSSSTRSGNTIVYTLEQSNPVPIPRDNPWRWDLVITTIVPIKLDSSIGAGLMDFSLYNMILEKLSISQGVGDITVILPEGNFPVEISQAVGRIVIEIPKGTPFRFNINRVVAGLSIPPDFENLDQLYYSPDAEETDEYILVDINQAVGGIIIRYSEHE